MFTAPEHEMQFPVPNVLILQIGSVGVKSNVVCKLHSSANGAVSV